MADGIPVLPGVLGSVPGVGACLPRGSPMFSQRSPSLFQNILRNVPGVQDLLLSFLPVTRVNLTHMMTKYQWVVSTRSVHDRFCSMTEFSRLQASTTTSTFGVTDSFREGGFDGAQKVGMGYGIGHRDAVYIYLQEDPCPYQIVLLGPIDIESGLYEYVFLSNWAKYPVIGLARDWRRFFQLYRNETELWLNQEGYLTDFNVQFADWRPCQRVTPENVIRNIMRQFFG